MKIVISSQIELLPSLFVRRCFDAFERNNNNGYSSLINHAQLTSIETCHFFSLSLSRLGIPADHPLRFPSKRGAAIAPKETEHRGDRGPSGNSIYRVLRFCSILPALSLSRRLLPSTHLSTLHPLSPCPRPSEWPRHVVYVQYPSTHRHCARVAARFIEKPLSLSREGRATTEIAGEFFVSRGRGIHRVHGRESFFPRVVG